MHFNPRSHEGSDTRLPSCFFSLFYFNPRSHEGSDTNMSLEKAVENISIHAPTRGATAAAPLTTAPSRISIHAPTRGATTCRIASFFTGRISIHAPTRGATLIDLFIRVFLDNFNPRSHEGSDGIHFVTPVVTVLFQSTLPRGERQDHKVKSFPLFEISIHAPTRGAT